MSDPAEFVSHKKLLDKYFLIHKLLNEIFSIENFIIVNQI